MQTSGTNLSPTKILMGHFLGHPVKARFPSFLSVFWVEIREVVKYYFANFVRKGGGGGSPPLRTKFAK